MRVVLNRVDERIEETAVEFREFTIVHPIGEMPQLAIALISFGGRLQWIGLQERGAIVATQVRKLRLSDLTEIEPPLDIEDLTAEMPAGLAQHVAWGLMPQRTSEEILSALERIRPGLGHTITHLQERGVPRDFNRAGYEVAAMEKDAIGLALNFQGLDRAPLQSWTQADEPRSFMRDLEGARLREDQIIAHDLGVFGDWDLVEGSAVGAIHYQQGEAGLTVVNVNRTPVEEALGVDLLYYHETYQSFVLVQYKRMEGTGFGQAYRPDRNLERELNLMRQVVPVPPNPVDQYSYRIGPGVCYLKLCKSIVLDPYSKSLIDGMYLPLEYFDACEPTALGPQGGRLYGYRTVPRHFNNTQFTELVQDGWVGSNGPLTERLRQLIEELVQRGDSVLLAVGTGQRVRRARR